MFPDAARSKRLIIVFVLVALAMLIRGRDLDRWCFTTDEFYLYRAESSIVEHGVPRFPEGGYYVRGIGLQYLSMLPVLAFPKPEREGINGRFKVWQLQREKRERGHP